MTFVKILHAITPKIYENRCLYRSAALGSFAVALVVFLIFVLLICWPPSGQRVACVYIPLVELLDAPLNFPELEML